MPRHFSYLNMSFLLPNDIFQLIYLAILYFFFTSGYRLNLIRKRLIFGNKFNKNFTRPYLKILLSCLLLDGRRSAPVFLLPE